MGAWLLSLLRRVPGSLDIIALTIAIVVLAFVIWPGWLRQAREDGKLEERAAWQLKQEEAIAKRDAAVSVAQRKIDTAETDMLAARAAGALKVNDLETALAAERKANEAAGKTGAAGDRCVPRRMPERVRRALNAFREQ